MLLKENNLGTIGVLFVSFSYLFVCFLLQKKYSMRSVNKYCYVCTQTTYGVNDDVLYVHFTSFMCDTHFNVFFHVSTKYRAQKSR